MNKYYMIAQRKRIELDKWFEGERLKRDPGLFFIFKWIQLNAARFREEWNQSLCKGCCHADDCGFEVTKICNKYKAHEQEV